MKSDGSKPREREALLARITVVLHAPESPGNVGAAARAVKNMGLGGMALVEPRPSHDRTRFAAEASKLAPGAADVLARLAQHATLGEALAPGAYLVATSARRRRALPVSSPREAAPRLVALARERPVALLFGREDHGLPTRLLAQAREVLRIPAAAAHPSLNLAQAVLVVAYELRLAALAPPPTVPRIPPRPADLGALVAEAEAALALADFLKARGRARLLAELEALLLRARPDAHEVRLLRGMCRQVRWLATRAGRTVA